MGKRIISRIMGAEELEAFRSGAVITPERRYDGLYTDAAAIPELREGALFFVPGDARGFDHERLSLWMKFVPGGCEGKVLAVFDAGKERVFSGEARAYGVNRTERLGEAYLPSYSRESVRLLFADEDFRETARYVSELRREYAGEACRSCECRDCGSLCGGIRVPAGYAIPYGKRDPMLEISDETWGSFLAEDGLTWRLGEALPREKTAPA